MKIEDLISGKKDNDEINVEGYSLPVSSLKNLLEEGYEHLEPYKNEKTFSLWGKRCTGCLTGEQLRNRA
ncbi:MAG: hypothetical protein ISS61_07445 [Desulfobacteraceae bacterium]|nr:hypothetical protein [Desulfobacteraceae bacterium]